ncbi:MAG: arginine--tRNA ligase [Phycisphaerales bacterium]|nr:arginine--tRNA ligase [Phycisphaerales bacterium]
MDPKQTISDAVQASFGRVLGEEYVNANPVVRLSQNQKFGDYQVNGIMGLAKKRGENPRELAQKITEDLDLGGFADSIEVAGPGFINVTLASESLSNLCHAMDNESLGVELDLDSHPVAIDLCGVNVAKQLHVGHLRSTIIGDSLARVFERLGRVVYRQNHLGDWGLPIAMVLERLLRGGVDLDSLTIEHLNSAYKDAQLRAKSDVSGLETAQRIVAGPHRLVELEEQNEGANAALSGAKLILVKLQQGDKDLSASWQKLIDCTMKNVYESLDLLNVKLGAEDNRGESFYRDKLGFVAQAFIDSSLAEEDEGALIVRFQNRDRPMLIRKSDGGFLYATTDLAAVYFRTQELCCDRVIYVVDARQRDHFRDLFDAAQLVGWDKTPDGAAVQLVHIPFGSVLGEDQKPLKTRSGSNVTLSSLLNEAVDRGTSEVVRRSDDPKAPTHGMCREDLETIGRQIGIGAIKYADLSNDLVRDYVFDMDRMISFEGNTGPYIQYACARITSLLEKSGERSFGSDVILETPEERQLVLQLLQYGEVVRTVAHHLEPHRLCTWLYELTDAFSSFYQACPVLRVEDEQVRGSRLRLSDITRRVLIDGLGLLGIEVPQKM